MEDSPQSDKNNFKSTLEGVYNEGDQGGESMVRHIDGELQALKDLALQMGGCVEKALERACYALVNKDISAFEEVYKQESRINDLQILIDESCVNVLAKQAPVAKDLRLVIAITRINTDLERMGDQAKNITYATRDLYRDWPQAQLPEQLTKMIEGVRDMVRSVLDAFSRRDIELSRHVLRQDDVIDDLRDGLNKEMKKRMKSGADQVDIGLSFLLIGKNLERVADHATNLAEEVIYLTTGDDIRHGHNVPVNS